MNNYMKTIYYTVIIKESGLEETRTVHWYVRTHWETWPFISTHTSIPVFHLGRRYGETLVFQNISKFSDTCLCAVFWVASVVSESL